jgi:hypothetical protein
MKIVTKVAENRNSSAIVRYLAAASVVKIKASVCVGFSLAGALCLSARGFGGAT